MDDNQKANSNTEQVQQATQTPAQPQASGQKKWKITVDRSLCIGAASCVALAMKTFVLDGENKAIVLEGEGDLPDTIKLAAESCPTKAIILVDAATGEQEYP